MMNKKRILIIGLILLLIAALIGGGIWFWQRNGKNNVVDVYPMEYLNSEEMYDYGSELTGIITSDYVQQVIPDGSKEIKEIYVEVGQVVKKGDKLLKYNVDEKELDVKLQKLQIDAAKLQIENMEKELEKLRNTKTVKGFGGSGTGLMQASLSLPGIHDTALVSVLAKESKSAKKADTKKKTTEKKTDTKKSTDKKSAKKSTDKKSSEKKSTKKSSDKKSSEKKSSDKKSAAAKTTDTKSTKKTAAQKKGARNKGEPDESGSESGDSSGDSTEVKTPEEQLEEIKKAAVTKIEQNRDTAIDKIKKSDHYYEHDETLAKDIAKDYIAKIEAVTIGTGSLEEATKQVEDYEDTAVASLTLVTTYGEKRDDVIKEIDTYLADKKYGKADENTKNQIYDTYCSDTGKIAMADDGDDITKAKEEALTKLKKLHGGPLYPHIDDAENQQAKNSGSGTTAETPIRYLLVRENGKEPTIAGDVVSKFFGDLSYIGKYIEFMVYKSENDYPKGTPELTYRLTPDSELKTAVDTNKNYTVPELKNIVKQKEEPVVEYLLKSLKKYTQHQAGKGTLKNKYKYYLKKNAPIKGSVINDLIKKKKYAIIRDYYSEDAYAAGDDPLNTITITPDTRFSKAISKNKTYTIKDLNKLLIVIKSVKVTPVTSGLKTVKTGNSYSFKVKVTGKNTSSLGTTWSVTNKKSKSTRISSGGVLTVGSDEKAAALKISAVVGSKKGSYLVKVKKTKSSSDSDSSSSSSSSSDSDNINTYTADELKEAIAEKEQELAEAKQDLNEARINYREEKKEIEAAIVRATIAGKVTFADKNVPADTPAVVVRADDGVFVKTAVNELDFTTVKVGGNITVTSNETMDTYTAVVREVSEYPVEGDYSEFGGNPNSSYYPIMAYIEDPGDLRLGERVSITYNSRSMGTEEGETIYLPMAYVRTEGKQSYVYKADENDRLVKANVKTGKVIQGQVIEILDGLTMEDKVAFPYGKNVREGARTKISEDPDDIIY